MLETFHSWPNAKMLAKTGWIDTLRIKQIIDTQKSSLPNQHDFDIELSHKIRNAIMKKADIEKKSILFE